VGGLGFVTFRIKIFRFFLTKFVTGRRVKNGHFSLRLISERLLSGLFLRNPFLCTDPSFSIFDIPMILIMHSCLCYVHTSSVTLFLISYCNLKTHVFIQYSCGFWNEALFTSIIQLLLSHHNTIFQYKPHILCQSFIWFIIAIKSKFYRFYYLLFFTFSHRFCSYWMYIVGSENHVYLYIFVRKRETAVESHILYIIVNRWMSLAKLFVRCHNK